MKLFMFLLILLSNHANSQFPNAKSFKEETLIEIIISTQEQKRLNDVRPKMTLGERIILKKLASDYARFLKTRKMDDPVSFEDFTSDPVKHYDLDLMAYYKKMNHKAKDTLLNCTKTSLKEIICPEGIYTFSGPQIEDDVNDNARDFIKDSTITNGTKAKGTSSSQ